MIYYRYFVTFITTLLSVTIVQAGCRIERKAMPCKLLQGITEREYSICLPESYNLEDTRTYPVIYLLHGGECHHTKWEENGHLKAVVDSLVSIQKNGRNDYSLSRSRQRQHDMV